MGLNLDMLSTVLQVDPELGSEQHCPTSARPSLPITTFLSQQSECLTQNMLVPGPPQSHSVIMLPTCSGSFRGHKPDFLLTVVYTLLPQSLSDCPSTQEVGREFSLKTKAKTLSTSAFSSLVATIQNKYYFQGWGHTPSLTFLFRLYIDFNYALIL